MWGKLQSHQLDLVIRCPSSPEKRSNQWGWQSICLWVRSVWISECTSVIWCYIMPYVEVQHAQPTFDMTHVRWFAPERITSKGTTPPTEKGDVWSFGSLCIEVLTGEDPYGSHADFYVTILLNQGTPPADRGSTTVDIGPKMWELLESSWQPNPMERPSMSDIQLVIHGMLPPRGE
jgi:Protein tyrosine and serine/threonine kinase